MVRKIGEDSAFSCKMANDAESRFAVPRRVFCRDYARCAFFGPIALAQ